MGTCTRELQLTFVPSVTDLTAGEGLLHRARRGLHESRSEVPGSTPVWSTISKLLISNDPNREPTSVIEPLTRLLR